MSAEYPSLGTCDAGSKPETCGSTHQFVAHPRIPWNAKQERAIPGLHTCCEACGWHSTTITAASLRLVKKMDYTGVEDTQECRLESDVLFGGLKGFRTTHSMQTVHQTDSGDDRNFRKEFDPVHYGNIRSLH